MDDSFDDAGFLFALPAFTIAYQSITTGYLNYTRDDGGKALLVFTDACAAEFFIEKRYLPVKPGERFEIKKIPDILSLIGFLVVAVRKGCTHLVLDGATNECSQRPIARVITAACRAFD